LLLEVLSELFRLLGTFLPLIAAPEQKKNEEEEQCTKDDEEDLPPCQFLATTLSGLLSVGIERWNCGRRTIAVGLNNQLGHANT
jgi:hypothetical protein